MNNVVLPFPFSLKALLNRSLDGAQRNPGIQSHRSRITPALPPGYGQKLTNIGHSYQQTKWKRKTVRIVMKSFSW